MVKQEPWVSVDEVVRHLGVAKDTIYRWIEAKGLPAHRVGRLWKFKLSQVDAWVEAGGASHDEQTTETLYDGLAARLPSKGRGK